VCFVLSLHSIDFDQFVSALGRIADRKYKQETAVALRQLMTKCVLPLYQRLKEKPTFIEDVVQVGRQEEVQQFTKEFLQPEVVRSRMECHVRGAANCSCVSEHKRVVGLDGLLTISGVPSLSRLSSSTPIASRCKACSPATPCSKSPVTSQVLRRCSFRRFTALP